MGNFYLEAVCFSKEPEDFVPAFQVASCILETGGPLRRNKKILFLLRSGKVPQPNKWGLPAGKIKLDKGERSLMAAWREVKEETGIVLELEKMELLNEVYVRYPDEYDFVFFMYRQLVEGRPGVLYNIDKHQNCLWMNPGMAISQLPLIGGLAECLSIIYNGQQNRQKIIEIK